MDVAIHVGLSIFFFIFTRTIFRGNAINTRITAFSTYLKLPRAVKMTVCLITKKCIILCHKFLLTVVLDLVMF